jgi:SAM-dependent methyltransferase
MPVAKPQNVGASLLGKIDFHLSRFVNRSKFCHFMPYEQGNRRNLLDIGCNDAKKLSYFDANGWQIYGIDISEPAVEAARCGIPQGQFYCGSLESANFEPESFDVIRLDNVLEHLEKPIETLKDIYRIIKPGGRLYLYVPNGESFTLCYLKGYSISSWIPFHLNLFSKRSLMHALREAGFQEEKVKCTLGTPLPWLYLSLKQLVRGQTSGKMNPVEKCFSIVLVPATFCLNEAGMGEEIVAHAIK